jgi:hypothetical protein
MSVIAIIDITRYSRKVEARFPETSTQDPLAETNSLRTAHLHRRNPPEDRRGGGELLRRSPQALAAKNFDEMLDASVA